MLGREQAAVDPILHLGAVCLSALEDEFLEAGVPTVHEPIHHFIRFRAGLLAREQLRRALVGAFRQEIRFDAELVQETAHVQ